MTVSKFIQTYQKVSVLEHPNSVLEAVPAPMVSCCISTYQHAAYIRQCLDGVLMQQASFPFEVIIGEDESADGTREICLEYATKHPGLIRLLLHDRRNNLKVNGKPSGRYQFIYTRYQARGKYVAICEGDDCWTDPLKLQKQVDMLEADSSLSGCVHRARVISEGESWKEEVFPDYPETGRFGAANALDHTRMFAATASLMYRRFEEVFEPWMTNCFMGDRILFANLVAVGPMGVLNDVMSVYRRHDHGASNKFLRNRGAIDGLESRLVFFENIQYIIGDSPGNQVKRIEMLRHFARAHTLMCLKVPGLSVGERLERIRASLLRLSYLHSLVYHNGRSREFVELLRLAWRIMRGILKKI